MRTKIYRVRLPDHISSQIESEAARRKISVSQLLRERIIASSKNDTDSVQILGSILKEAIISRKYSAYTLANIVEDRDALRQMSARFHSEAEEAKSKLLSSYSNEG